MNNWYKDDVCRCKKCGEVFNALDAWFRDGEMSCPECGEERHIEYGVRCEDCGEFIPEEENDFTGVCADCFDKYVSDEAQVIEYGAENTDNVDVSINGLFLKAFVSDEINDILMDAFKRLPEERRHRACRDFCEDDPDHFVSFVRRA